MTSHRLWIKVYVLSVLVCQGSAQCPKAVDCLNNLGLNIFTSGGSKSGDITMFCSNTNNVVQCYDLFTKCSMVGPISRVLPGNGQIQATISTTCKNLQNVSVPNDVLTCVPATFPTEASKCLTKVQIDPSDLNPFNLKGQTCSLMDSLLTCVISVKSLENCGDVMNVVLTSLKNELLSASCPSRSPKFASWLSFTIVAAFISSVSKRL